MTSATGRVTYIRSFPLPRISRIVHRPAIGRMLSGLAAIVGATLSAACAPDRIPASTVSQGDAGIAFHGELASLRGAGVGLRVSSGESYGGGSSSSALSLRESGVRDLRVGGRVCDWLAAADPSADPTRPMAERLRGAGMEEWLAANCVNAGELR